MESRINGQWVFDIIEIEINIVPWNAMGSGISFNDWSPIALCQLEHLLFVQIVQMLNEVPLDLCRISVTFQRNDVQY